MRSMWKRGVVEHLHEARHGRAPCGEGSVAGAEPEGLVTLVSVGVDEEVEVLGVHEACPLPQRRRLFDLGFVPGSVVRVDLVSPLGNPVAYLVHGCSIALRHDQAGYILVRRRGGFAVKD